MTPVQHNRQQHHFYFPGIDTHVLVENQLDGVILRATSRSFSERRKALFIRYLAAEGCIPIQYQWFADCEQNGFFGIRWIIDNSWLVISPELTRRTTRFMRRLLIGAGLSWLAMILFIFLRNA